MTRKLLFGALGALVLGLAGCASLSTTVATPNQEYVGLNAYLAAVKTANNYLLLPLCPTGSPLCRTQSLSQSVYSALRSARVARKQITLALEQAQPASLTAISALEAAYAVIQQIPSN